MKRLFFVAVVLMIALAFEVRGEESVKTVITAEIHPLTPTSTASVMTTAGARREIFRFMLKAGGKAEVKSLVFKSMKIADFQGGKGEFLVVTLKDWKLVVLGRVQSDGKPVLQRDKIEVKLDQPIASFPVELAVIADTSGARPDQGLELALLKIGSAPPDAKIRGLPLYGGILRY